MVVTRGFYRIDETIQCRAVVVAAPPCVVDDVVIEPPLSERAKDKDARDGDVVRRLGQGRGDLLRALLAEGERVGRRLHEGAAQVWWEACSPETDGATVLVGLGVGVDIDVKNLRRVVVDALGPPFGAKAVEAHLVKVECKAWMDDDLTYRAGTERDYGHELLQAPHDGRIFFAGTRRRPRTATFMGRCLRASERPCRCAWLCRRSRRRGASARASGEGVALLPRPPCVTARPPRPRPLPAVLSAALLSTGRTPSPRRHAGRRPRRRRHVDPQVAPEASSSMSRDQLEPDVMTKASACMASTSATSEW